MMTGRPWLLLSLVTAGLLLGSSFGPALADESDNQGMPKQETVEDALPQPDRDFLVREVSGNYTEIQAGQMALQRGTNTVVQQFAQTLIDDRTQRNSMAAALARTMGLELPSGPVDRDHLDLLATLTDLTGADFDRYYLAEMVQVFKTDIAENQQAAHELSPPFANYATQALPTFYQHQQTAQQLAQQFNAPVLANHPAQ
jgi:putative membrane protein